MLVEELPASATLLTSHAVYCLYYFAPRLLFEPGHQLKLPEVLQYLPIHLKLVEDV